MQSLRCLDSVNYRSFSLALHINYLLHIIYTNIIVALSAGVLSAGYSFMLQIEHWYFYGLFSFFSTFSVYNGQRLIKSKNPTQTPWLMWVQRNEKSLYLATFASGLLTISCLLLIGKISVGSVLLLIGSGVISLFYVIPIRGVSMRDVPYIKIYLIAFTWAIVVFLFPALNEGVFSWNVLLQAFVHTLFIVSVAIPFDIRDMKFDTASHKTIPQLIGLKAAKVFSFLLLFLFAGLMLLLTPQLAKNLLFYAAIGLNFVLLLLMNEKRGDLYCAGAIDGAIGLVGLSYFFVQLSS